ncbi:conserved Plasmodium protein, unknown function [Plasmodium ovale wallikeri]|uniref:Uncharacterized protein n=2 Tax=Plasmodium ovale TaxID=36330 RepID=A0A1A8YRW8_PLAOA|nr:conserved Plasmodium protein, unknown function [Plasmodium ovale wallikeri]
MITWHARYGGGQTFMHAAHLLTQELGTGRTPECKVTGRGLIRMNCAQLALLLSVFYTVSLSNNDEKGKKLQCQGVFIYEEREEHKVMGDEDLRAQHIPYFLIYKSESNGMYNSSEHFNGLTIFIKSKKKNYEQVRKKVFSTLLRKIYLPEESFPTQRFEANEASADDVPKAATEWTSGSTMYRSSVEGRHIKGSKDTLLEISTSLVEENMHSLYVDNVHFEELYKGCFSPFKSYTEGIKNGNNKTRTIHMIDKNCLSHKHILLYWNYETEINRLNKKANRNYKNCDNKCEKENENSVWLFMYITMGDLVKAKFTLYVYLFFLRMMSKKNKGSSFLFHFLINKNVLRDIHIESFIQRSISTTEKTPTRLFLTTKYIFHTSFHMYTKIYNCVDLLSFFFSKFVCEDKNNKIFFMNNFVNNNIYVYSEKYDKEKKYENNTYTHGVKKGLFLMSYIYSLIRENNWKNYEHVRKKKEKKISNYGIANFPLLFQDHLYGENDYIFYDEKENKIVRNTRISNAHVHKDVEGEGIHKKAKTVIDIRLGESASITEVATEVVGTPLVGNNFSLVTCNMVVVDLYPNNIIVDREKMSNDLSVTSADTENIKEKSPHVITKYENRILLKKVNDSVVFSCLFCRLLLCRSIGERGISQLSATQKGNNKRKEKGNDPILINDKGGINGMREKWTCGRYERYKNGNHSNCDRVVFSYETVFSSRYVSPCFKKKAEMVHSNIGRGTCTNYDVVTLSNAKLFLNCFNGGNTQVNRRVNKELQFEYTIYADAQNVYLHESDNVRSVHTKDFYIYLDEISFYPLLSHNGNEEAENDDHGHVVGKKPILKEKKKKKKITHEKEYSYENGNSFHNYVHVKTINKDSRKHRMFNFKKIYSDRKFPHIVVATNGMQEMRTPTYYSLYNGEKYYYDIAYLYAMPRGNENYYYVLAASSFVSLFLVLFTFYLSQKFTRCGGGVAAV